MHGELLAGVCSCEVVMQPRIVDNLKMKNID